MKRFALITAAILAAAGCNRTAEPPVSNTPANEAAPVENAALPESNMAASLPDDRTPLEEPKGAIDPKSAEAASQVVQSFGALIEQKRWAEAEALWGDAATAKTLTAGLKRNSESHLEIGKPGDMEGAAGSIFVAVPVVFYGKQEGGKDFRRAADVTLRRVNDVDGSTEAQRRWHIERIDWKP